MHYWYLCSLPLHYLGILSVMPIAAAFQLAHSVQTIANGVIRGCGRQRIGAVLNLVGK